MLTLNYSIKELNRIGSATAIKLRRLGVEIVQDFLFYFPFRYEDFSKILKIKDAKPGMSVNIVGQIELIQNKRSPRRRMFITEALVRDETESIKVIWFNQPFLTRTLKEGDAVSLAGRVEEDFTGAVMMSPVYEKVRNADWRGLSADQRGINAVHTQGLVPIYHLTNDLSQKQIRYLMKQVIHLADRLSDWLPEEVRKNSGLLGLGEAVRKVHFPKSNKDIADARRRLAFDELFLIQMQSQLIKKDLDASRAEPIPFREEETKKLIQSLPFKLTDAQRKAAWGILKDLGKDKPMSRLLEGDVGSGKTIVALIAMFNAALAGKQAVLMVPTEILASQHYESFCRLLKGWGIKIGLVTRGAKKTNHESGIMNQGDEKNRDSEFIIHDSQIIIGTHALIQEKINFKNLVLAIIDEQHRFGVEQRKTLIKKTSPEGDFTPHLLSTTATPIPRSLALALYGDLDLSIINQMPADRKKILTKVVAEENRGKAYDFIREQIMKGRQAFVICPLINISDPLRLSGSEASKLGVKSVKEEFEKLDKAIFPEIKMGMLHGKMKAKEKEETMRDFLENKIKVLVSTSVVEVGVDVPNATIMMIEGADRFGLAQLHQFRGRVGRGEYQSYCFLFSESEAEKTLKRLNALTEHHDGFALAKIDLKFRGPGEVYGTMQKGFPELKIASLFDYVLMKLAKEEAERIVNKDASLDAWPKLKEKLGEWDRQTHLE